MSECNLAIQLMEQCESEFAHVWMVRTFLKHCPEAEEDEDVAEVHRLLYDVMLALGPSAAESNAELYFRQLGKKLRRLRQANELWQEIQPEVSGHMNYRMAAVSLATAVEKIEEIAKRATSALAERGTES